MSASIFRPVRCSSCGGLSIVSRAAVLSAAAVAEIAAVPLMLVKPPLPFVNFLSLVVLLALMGCVYSFGFAPMEQLPYAEAEPRWTATTYALVAVALAALCLIPAYAIFRL